MLGKKIYERLFYSVPRTHDRSGFYYKNSRSRRRKSKGKLLSFYAFAQPGPARLVDIVPFDVIASQLKHTFSSAGFNVEVIYPLEVQVQKIPSHVSVVFFPLRQQSCRGCFELTAYHPMRRLFAVVFSLQYFVSLTFCFEMKKNKIL